MHILVTAGNTLVPIDRVRCITNIFTGRTGTAIALHCRDQGHEVCLLTSHPDLVSRMRETGTPAADRWTVRSFRTFQDLGRQMEAAIVGGGLDVVIHCAAVSDYQAGGVYAPAPMTFFSPTTGYWESTGPGSPALVCSGLLRVAGRSLVQEASVA